MDSNDSFTEDISSSTSLGNRVGGGSRFRKGGAAGGDFIIGGAADTGGLGGGEILAGGVVGAELTVTAGAVTFVSGTEMIGPGAWALLVAGLSSGDFGAGGGVDDGVGGSAVVGGWLADAGEDADGVGISTVCGGTGIACAMTSLASDDGDGGWEGTAEGVVAGLT
jgi:hypothetical protein